MTLSEFFQLITALSAFGAMALGWWNTLKIKEVHVATNSMKDQLVATTAVAALAEGKAIGRAEVHYEQKNGNPPTTD